MNAVIAWRNVWRQPRRTGVVLTAVVIGVWIMIFLGAITNGVLEWMIQGQLSLLTGSLQIHGRGYREDPGLEHRIDDPASVLTIQEPRLPPGARIMERVRVEAVAATAWRSVGVAVAGIRPSAESRFSFLKTGAWRGDFLADGDDHGLLMGHALAEKLGTAPGRKVVITAQAADGELVSRAFRITGEYRAKNEAFERRQVFITLNAAREMLGLKNAVTELAVILPDRNAADAVKTSLAPEGIEGIELEIHTWRELLPLVVAYAKMSEASVFIWYIVVFIAMSFGVVNTLLMAVFERTREFGLLRALGMTPGRIVGMVLTEAIIVLGMGVLIGDLMAWITVQALSDTGIDLSALARGMEYVGLPRVIFPRMDGSTAVMANVMVLVLGLAVSLYPARKAARITPVEAMRRE